MALRICNPQQGSMLFLLLLLGDYKSPGFNRSNLFYGGFQIRRDAYALKGRSKIAPHALNQRSPAEGKGKGQKLLAQDNALGNPGRKQFAL